MALFDEILQFTYYATFILIMFYGTRIQTTIVLVGVKRSLGRLGKLRTEAHDSVMKSLVRFKADQKDVE